MFAFIVQVQHFTLYIISKKYLINQILTKGKQAKHDLHAYLCKCCILKRCVSAGDTRNTILPLLKQGFCSLNNRKYKICLKSFLRPREEKLKKRIEYIKHVIGVKRLNKEIFWKIHQNEVNSWIKTYSICQFDQTNLLHLKDKDVFRPHWLMFVLVLSINWVWT